MVHLDEEDRKELKELEKEIKKLKELNEITDNNLLEQLEYNLNKLKNKIKNEN